MTSIIDIQMISLLFFRKSIYYFILNVTQHQNENSSDLAVKVACSIRLILRSILY